MKKKVISVLVAILIIACSALAVLAKQDKKKQTASFINSLKSARIHRAEFYLGQQVAHLKFEPAVRDAISSSS